MKIAFDTYNLGITSGSGNKTYTVEIIKALHNAFPEDDLQLITFWRKRKGCTAIFREDEHLLIKAMLPHTKLLGKGLENVVRASYHYFERRIASSCNLFHCTNPINFPVGMPNVVTTIHDIIGLYDKPWVPENVKLFAKKYTQIIINRSLLLFTNSSFTAQELFERFPEAQEKTIVTPLAADPCYTMISCDRNFLTRYGIQNIDRPYFLSVGEIHPRKNTLAMIKAFEIVGAKNPDLRYILIGQAKQGEYTKQVYGHASVSPLRDRIIFLHSVTKEDLVCFYNHAIGMAFFSFFEGFGLPIIEAMACGCPVAASRSSSMTEIAANAAILIDPEKFESMVEGMDFLINSDSKRSDLKEKGLKRASEYSWGETALLTHDGYNKALGQ